MERVGGVRRGEAGERARGTVLEQHRVAQVVGAGADARVQPLEHRDALALAGAAHRREGAPGGRDRGQRIRAVAEPYLADAFLGGRVEEIGRLAAVRLDERAVDVGRGDDGQGSGGGVHACSLRARCRFYKPHNDG